MTKDRWAKLQAMALRCDNVSSDYLIEALGAIRCLQQVEKDAAKVIRELSKGRK